MTYLLQTHQLTKIINKKTLVSDVNLHVKKGEIYGFLGQNGAGKTTVMKMIVNLWKPTEGMVELFGEVLAPTSYEVLKRMGSIIEFPCFYEHLSGRNNLQLHCEYMGYYLPGCVEQALDMLGLAQAADMPVKSYSLGMKQRLGIARAVLCRPELLVLDEPTNGLDPAGMKMLRDLLRMLCEEYQTTILISSHMLAEVESIADTVGIIHRGRMMREISMRQIAEMGKTYTELVVENANRAAYVLAESLGLNNFKLADEHTIRVYEDRVTVAEIAKAFALSDVQICAIGQQSEALEDYFLRLTREGEDVCGS